MSSPRTLTSLARGATARRSSELTFLAILLLYGEQWLAAALPLSALMVAQFIGVAFGMNWELFVLRGETGRQARYEVARLVLGVPACCATMKLIMGLTTRTWLFFTAPATVCASSRHLRAMSHARSTISRKVPLRCLP